MSFETQAFCQTGPTIKFTAGLAASLGEQAKAVGSTPASQYRVFNVSAGTIFVASGQTAIEARDNAVIPTGSGGGAKNSMPLATLTSMIVSAPSDCFWSGIAASAGDFYVTPGRGL